MSYPKRLLSIRPRGGIATDTPQWATPPEFFTLGNNLVFRQGFAERAPSSANIYNDPTVAPYAIKNVQISGVNYWVYVGATASYVVETSNHTEITHASGQQSNTEVHRLSLDLLNGIPFFSNGLDEPMYWDGNVSNNFVDLPGWTATETCGFMVAHRFHLFAFDISGPSGDFPNQVKWSSAANPGNVPASWTAAATNEAGDTVLADTPGELVSAANLRGSLMIYKNGSTHIADYVGGEEIYAFRTLFVQSGALARHTVADINGAHFVVTDGDIIITDGQTIKSVAQNKRRRAFFNSIDQTYYKNTIVKYFRQKNEVWVMYPEAGSERCTRAMIYDLANNAWGDRELLGISNADTGIVNDTAADETWDSDAAVWNADLEVWDQQNFSLATEELVLADSTNTELVQIGTGDESLVSTLRREDLDFDDPVRFKFVKRLHLRVEAATSIDFLVRIGKRNATGESISWNSALTYNSDDGFLNVTITGRYISIEIAATTNTTFKITGIELEAELRGYH